MGWTPCFHGASPDTFLSLSPLPPSPSAPPGIYLNSCNVTYSIYSRPVSCKKTAHPAHRSLSERPDVPSLALVGQCFLLILFRLNETLSPPERGLGGDRFCEKVCSENVTLPHAIHREGLLPLNDGMIPQRNHCELKIPSVEIALNVPSRLCPRA